uniref:F-box/LRR-repeat protein 15/At3g58940/PEG3-like LRR domain-containing protein n=1 Tax=Leersia perrieri TaxID=77586 RepID=A0A0D9VXQ3_9ORYZ
MAAARVACDVCREDQLQMECCSGGLLRGGGGSTTALPDAAADGGEEEQQPDRISALPDDLLLRILTCLGCARAAAHTALLARRWRGLWARLPELSFHCIAPAPLQAALAMVVPTPALLDIDLCHYSHHALGSSGVASLLGAAAAVAPAEFVFHVAVTVRGNPVVLPCFDRTASIKLDVRSVDFTLPPPPAGGFPALESLHLDYCSIDLADMIPRCPRLRKLSIPSWNSDTLTVCSPSLEELGVYAIVQISSINIVTPVLKRLYLNAHCGISTNFGFAFSAPAVEDLTWKCECKIISYSFGVLWRMWSMSFELMQLSNNSECATLQPQHHPRVGVLSLILETSVFIGVSTRSFEQEISRFQVIANLSVLELNVSSQGHVYGAIVLHLLGLCPHVQRLRVMPYDFGVENACFANYRCDQPNNWRSQSISLTDLIEVEIGGFRGQDHEVDLLKVILRCAPVLEIVTVRFSRKVSLSDSGCMGINGILKAYPSVQFNIYY